MFLSHVLLSHLLHSELYYIHTFHVGVSPVDDEMDSVPYNLTANPIYDGPMYDTVQEPFKQLLTLNPQPATVPASESVYSDNPSHGKQRSVPGSGYEEVALRKLEAEDCYIQMQSYKRQ